MARKIGQIRYYGTGSNSNTDKNSLIDGSAFSSYYPIVQLGVQALPGTMLAINNSETPLSIGATGIYELNIDGLATITSLCFFRASLTNLPNDASIIVDFAYDEEA